MKQQDHQRIMRATQADCQRQLLAMRQEYSELDAVYNRLCQASDRDSTTLARMLAWFAANGIDTEQFYTQD